MQSSLTPKGEQARQHILDTALTLFAAQGYEKTTMREISATAGYSLGLAYRYFERKEDLVMALYEQLAVQFDSEVEQIPAAKIGVMYEQALLIKLSMLAPHKNAMSALFSVAMNPSSGVAVLGESTAHIRTTVRAMYVRMLKRATDAPGNEQIEQLATVLYGAYLAILLFWLYDHQPDYPATRDLIDFAHSGLSLARPFMQLPITRRLLKRLAGIVSHMIQEENQMITSNHRLSPVKEWTFITREMIVRGVGSGAFAGGLYGTVLVPIYGTVIGALLGGVMGLVLGLIIGTSWILSQKIARRTPATEGLGSFGNWSRFTAFLSIAIGARLLAPSAFTPHPSTLRTGEFAMSITFFVIFPAIIASFVAAWQGNKAAMKYQQKFEAKP